MLAVGVIEYKRLLHASLFTAASTGITCYLLKYPLPRTFFVLAFPIGVLVLAAGRFLLRHIVQRARRRGALLHRVVIAGSEGHVDEIATVLSRESWLGYDVVGALTPDPGERSNTRGGTPLLGSSTSVARVALDAGADVVFLAGGAFASSTAIRRLAWELEHEDVQVVIAPSVTDVSRERISIRPVGGLPLVHLEKPRSQGALRRTKRGFDMAASIGILVAAAPRIVFAAVSVKLDDGGPVFQRQARVGRDGKLFELLKFRTVATGAEQLFAELRSERGFDCRPFEAREQPAGDRSRALARAVPG